MARMFTGFAERTILAAVGQNASRVILPAVPDLDVRLAPGRAAFNRGAFFAAHELWETVWRELAGEADSDDDRQVVQGLIQIAAGLHHAQQGRTRPAVGLLARGASKLARHVRASATTLPIAALVGDIARLRAALEAPGAAPDLADVRF
jgi:hypothetical protein